MLPERLVTVGWFGTPDEAADPQAKLEKAGVTSYLSGEFYRHNEPVELRVPEGELNRALAVLEIDPKEWASEEPRGADPRFKSCPDCGSGDSRPIRPYALYALVTSLIVLAASVALGQIAIGMGGVFLGWFLAMWLSRDSGKTKCLHCGRKWIAS